MIINCRLFKGILKNCKMNFTFNKMLETVKTQTKQLNLLLPSLPRIPKSFSQNSFSDFKWPSLLDELHWPLFPKNDIAKNTFSSATGTESDIVYRFIKVIQADEDEGLCNNIELSSLSLRKTDRDEIRKKLAMEVEGETENEEENILLKKPSLQSRIKNGKNLQICFVNETASDCESQCSDTESVQDKADEFENKIQENKHEKQKPSNPMVDFATHQVRLQTEARFALSQAKDMARMQMEIEKQNQIKSPITEIVRESFSKIGFPLSSNKRRMSRQILTDINVAQLQVIVNDLHTQIQKYNEKLVHLLLNRDDLHMEQDSMLVDIEDVSKHLSAKQRLLEGKTEKSKSENDKNHEKSKFENDTQNSLTKMNQLKSIVQK